jgi:hypothetical protein
MPCGFVNRDSARRAARQRRMRHETPGIYRFF